MSKTGKNSKAVQVTQLIAGTKKRLPNGAQTVTIGGADRTVDDCTKLLQSFVDNRTAVETAKANAKAKVDAERAQMATLLAFIGEFVKFVRLTFGNAADVLADFGLAPIKARAPISAEAKAAAVAKREATREARGTTSKKAKKGIKGNVTAKLVVTPATPSAAPSAAVSPAPTASGGAPGGTTPPSPTLPVTPVKG
jgi:hypothetical protein